jgi:hypothetical protein
MQRAPTEEAQEKRTPGPLEEHLIKGTGRQDNEVRSSDLSIPPGASLLVNASTLFRSNSLEGSDLLSYPDTFALRAPGFFLLIF